VILDWHHLFRASSGCPMSRVLCETWDSTASLPLRILSRVPDHLQHHHLFRVPHVSRPLRDVGFHCFITS